MSKYFDQQVYYITEYCSYICLLAEIFAVLTFITGLIILDAV